MHKKTETVGPSVQVIVYGNNTVKRERINAYQSSYPHATITSEMRSITLNTKCYVLTIAGITPEECQIIRQSSKKATATPNEVPVLSFADGENPSNTARDEGKDPSTLQMHAKAVRTPYPSTLFASSIDKKVTPATASPDSKIPGFK